MKSQEIGVNSLNADLDLVRTVRRQRMHGFGINFLLGKTSRISIARLAFSKPMREHCYYDDCVKVGADPTDLK
jgi:hypothetical protein